MSTWPPLSSLGIWTKCGPVFTVVLNILVPLPVITVTKQCLCSGQLLYVVREILQGATGLEYQWSNWILSVSTSVGTVFVHN